MARTNKRANEKPVEEHLEESLRSQATLLALTLNAFYWVDDSMQNLLKKGGWPDVTRFQSQVLTCLGDGLVRTSDIARHMGVSRQVVNRCVKELVELGIIKLTPDPDDKRAKVIAPTKQGKRIMPLASKSLATIEETLEARIGARNFQKLRTILEIPWGEPLE